MFSKRFVGIADIENKSKIITPEEFKDIEK